jgi:hypothetical protein
MFDNDRLAETGRDLLDAAELRQMAEHTQAVAIIGSAPPVRFGFPHCAKGGPLAHPLPREIAQPVSLADAEAALAKRNVEETEILQDEPGTGEKSHTPDHKGDQNGDRAKDIVEEDIVEEDEEVLPQDPILFPLIDERQWGISQKALSVPPNPEAANADIERINEEAMA